MAPPKDSASMPWSNRAATASLDKTSGEAGANAADPQKHGQRGISYAELQRENISLKKELEQCRKREEAVRVVFIRNHEKEQQLSKKAAQIEIREARWETKKKCLELGHKHLQEEKAIVSDYVEEQRKLANALEASINQSSTGIKDDDRTKTGASESKVKKPSRLQPFMIGNSGSLFESESYAHFEEYETIISAEKMKDFGIELLRRHDYYKGWLDCMRTQERSDAYCKGLVDWDEVSYLWNKDDFRSPMNAGANVGMLFAWSALCAEYGEQDNDTRLDGRTWDLHDLHPPQDFDPKGFWTGVSCGKKIATKKFRAKIESGFSEPPEKPNRNNE